MPGFLLLRLRRPLNAVRTFLLAELFDRARRTDRQAEHTESTKPKNKRHPSRLLFVMGGRA